MKNLTPTDPVVPAFAPVPRKYRFDGWTPERQRAFIAALAETGSVTAAARRINMSKEGAYFLRRQPGAEGFRTAWTAALDRGVQRLADVAIERATEGVSVPIFWRGEQVGERRWHDNRLLMFILRHHMPDRYGAAGIGGGTKSRETLEREAAEICPVCRERAAAQAEAAANAPTAAQEHEQATNQLLRDYLRKLHAERRYRRAGEVVAADFTVRQLTVIELMLERADLGDRLMALWTAAGGLYDGDPPEADEIGTVLSNMRERYWAQTDDPPRPALRSGADGSTALFGGPTMRQREAAQAASRARIASAQAEWEAAATEEGWERWNARRGE